MPRIPMGQTLNYLLLILLLPFLIILIILLAVSVSLLQLFPNFKRLLEEIPDSSLTEAYHRQPK